MSVSTRKIVFFTVNFRKFRTHETYFDAEEFLQLLEYINLKSASEKLRRDPEHNKAYGLQGYSQRTKENTQVFRIIFHSCKYNHSPEYLSSRTGETTASTKLLEQGENERTHFVGKVCEDYLYVAFEQRQSGASFGSLIKYLNKFLKMMQQDEEWEGTKSNLEYETVAHDNVEEIINNLRRAASLTVSYDKQLLNSPELAHMGRDITHCQDTFDVTIKAKPREGLVKHVLTDVWHLLQSDGTKVRRVRIKGIDEESNNILIDSDLTRKNIQINSEISEIDGTVISQSLITQMEDLLFED